MSTSPVTTDRSGFLALFLGAVALRPQLAVIGPLLPLITVDLGISHSAAGLLATIPILCMGLFATAAPVAAHRFGTRAAIGACIAAAALAGLGRALAPTELLLVLTTIPLGIAMGLGGALLPIVVRERFSERPAAATGAYTNGFQLGAALVAAVAVPIALLLGGWRWALGTLSISMVGVAAAWFVLVPPAPRPAAPASRAPSLASWPIRRPVVWALAILFGLRSIVFQGLSAWLPSVYVERGWPEANAALLVFAITMVSMPVTTLAMPLADRRGSRRAYLGVASVALAVALGGLVIVPAFGVLWAFAIGAALGILFPLTMTLPLDIAEHPSDVGAVSAMMFGVGYLMAAASPVGLGAIRDITGSFAASMGALAVIAVAMTVITLAMSPERLAARRARAG